MKVRDVMTTPVVTVGPDATFAAVVDQLLGSVSPEFAGQGASCRSLCPVRRPT